MSKHTIGDKLFSDAALKMIDTTLERSRRIEAALLATKHMSTSALEDGVVADLLAAAKVVLEESVLAKHSQCGEGVTADCVDAPIYRELQDAVAKAEGDG